MIYVSFRKVEYFDALSLCHFFFASQLENVRHQHRSIIAS